MKILTHKYCPVCQTKVEWKRFVYKNWGFSKWNCPTCNTKLTFNLTRRLFGAVIFLIIGFILVEVATAYKLPTVVYFLIVALFWIAFFLNDGVIVDKTLSKKEKKLKSASKKPFYIALFILLIFIVLVYLVMRSQGYPDESINAVLYSLIFIFLIVSAFVLLGTYQKK